MRTLMTIRPFKWILLGPVLAVLLVGHGFGADWPLPPPRQPAQIKSQVYYDPKLSDPFFETERWTYPYWEAEDVNGRVVYTRAQSPSGEKELPRSKNTARCLSSHQFEHTVDFCRAKFLDGDSIELFIYDDHSPIPDNLRIVVQKGVFWSQYWTYYKKRTEQGNGLRWITKKQALTLDNKVFRKGDVIKGRIVFECVEEVNNPSPSSKYPYAIRIEGVFKTIVE